MQWPIIPIKNLTFLFPMIFLSKHISLHALGRLKWVLDIIWPLNQHFKLKNQRNRLKQVWQIEQIRAKLKKPWKFLFWFTSNDKILEVWSVSLCVLNEETYFSLCNFYNRFLHFRLRSLHVSSVRCTQWSLRARVESILFQK